MHSNIDVSMLSFSQAWLAKTEKEHNPYQHNAHCTLYSIAQSWTYRASEIISTKLTIIQYTPNSLI